jgi:hypothetical protein
MALARDGRTAPAAQEVEIGALARLLALSGM